MSSLSIRKGCPISKGESLHFPRKNASRPSDRSNISQFVCRSVNSIGFVTQSRIVGQWESLSNNSTGCEREYWNTHSPKVARGFGGVMLSGHAEKVEAGGVNAFPQNTLCQGQLETVALQYTESHEKESKSRPQRIHVPKRENERLQFKWISQICQY